MPYSYSEMWGYIKALKKKADEKRKLIISFKLILTVIDFKFIRFESLGNSYGGLDIPLLKITNKSDEGTWVEKPVIVIIGRQHCGETHSSFIIHGFVNFLLSKDILCNKLRDKYEFWVLPIVNPDGVVIGNYRTNTQGKDMNRHFFSDGDPDADKNGRAVEVELIRTFLKEQFPKGGEEGKEDKSHLFKMFLDIHAHSAQTSIFIYAPLHEAEADRNESSKFVKILDSMSSYFSEDNSKFGNEKYKKNCARLGIMRDFGIINSYTIESSCWGYDVKDYEPENEEDEDWKIE